MKIKEITLKNFKGTEHLTITPDTGVTAIVGKTGVGKSSIIKAVEYALTNPTSRQMVYKKIGTDNMSVVFDAEDLRIESGRINIYNRQGKYTGESKFFKLNGNDTTYQNIQAKIEEKFGVRTDAILNSISTSVLQKMNSGELAAFLLSYIPDTMDVDRVISYIKEPTEEVEQELRMRLPEAPETFDIDVIKGIRDDFLEERRNCKKKKVALEDAVAKRMADPKITLEEIKKRYDKVMKDLGALDGAKKTHEEWEKKVRDYQNKKKEIERLETIISSYKESAPDAEQYKKNRLERDAIITGINMASNTINVLKRDIEKFETALKNLNTKICPLSNKLVCTTDKTLAKDELLSDIAKNREIIFQQEDIIKTKTKKKKKIEADIAAYEKAMFEYQKVEKAKIRKEEIEKVLVNPGNEPQNPDVAKLLDQKKNLVVAEDYVKKYDIYTEALNKLKKTNRQIKMLDTLCSLLGDKGEITDGINEYYIQIFNDILESRCRVLNIGLNVKLVNDSGIYIYYEKNGISCEVKNASAGEEAIIYFIMADMINQLSGFRVLFFDNIDKMDEETFEGVLRLVQSKDVLNEYDHIFLMGIDHTDTINLLEKNGVKLMNYSDFN